VIADNLISANGGNGIYSEQADGSTYEGNRITKNAGAGLYAYQSTATIRNNTSSSNAGDGLRIADTCNFIPYYRIGGNHLDHNGALGIDLIPGPLCSDLAALLEMADEGANTAKHNGDPRECLHIVCTKN